MKEKVMDALKQHFKPEFLNRIDEVIVFHEHDLDAVIQMVDTMTKRLVTQLESQGLGIELTHNAKVHLAKNGYDPQLGARPLRRAIQRTVEDPLSEKLLYKEFTAGQIIVVDTEPDPDKEGEQRIDLLGGRGLRAAVVGRAGDDVDGAGDHRRPGRRAGRRRRRPSRLTAPVPRSGATIRVQRPDTELPQMRSRLLGLVGLVTRARRLPARRRRRHDGQRRRHR